VIGCRQQVSDCLDSREEALFSLCDGVLSNTYARTLPERSHAPFCDRQWPSMDAVVADGTISVEQLNCTRGMCNVLAELPTDAPLCPRIAQRVAEPGASKEKQVPL
jgi:hypothetical protein